MENLVHLHFNYGGTWKSSDGKLEYIGGDVDILSNFDPDYLCYSDVKERYTNHLGLNAVESIFVLQPGMEVSDGLLSIDDDESIRKVLYHINQVSWVDEIHFYAKHDAEDSLFRYVQIADIDLGVNSFSFMSTLGEEGLTHNEIICCDSGRPVGYVSEEVDNEDCEDDKYSVDSSDEECNLEDDRMRVERYEINGFRHFVVGMTFVDAKEARAAISHYCVTTGRILKLKPNEPGRIRAKCTNEKGCPFTLLISKDGKNPGLAVKTLTDDHTCLREFKIPQASASFLAEHYREKICKNPNFRIRDMKDDAKSSLKLNVTFQKCKRAKKMIIQELNGSYKSEFGYLEAYAEALKRSNPGTKAEIELCKESLKDGRRVFKRIFILFHACKVGWKSGCRPMIGLDGCFLKGVSRGQLLAATGVDANGQMFPIAWAVIDKENTNNWRWFISWLKQELELGNGSALTVISDMQKGLLNAVERVLPLAEHRWCARHIHANWSKKWNGDVLKKKFWICAWSTYDEQFKDNLKKLGEVSRKAAEDLMRYPPHTWCRAYFSGRAKSDSVDNNISECFNSWIKEARHKPIISMLEDIRTQVMGRLRDNKQLADKWFTDWSPSCMKIYQDNKEYSIECKAIFNGDDGFEIGEGEDKHTVHIDKQLCTCRAWDLTGIPCEHAICALHHLKIDPKQRISPWYHKTTYLMAYRLPLLPVPGKKFMRCDEFLPIEPPPVTKLAGRPRKKRIRGNNEPKAASKMEKLSKRGVPQTCGNCHEEGHNRKSCKNISNQNNTSESHESSKRRRSQVRGYGAYVSLSTGQTILNPGMASEVPLGRNASRSPSIDVDPQTRYPIPNERELKNKDKRRAPSSGTTRNIKFVGDGSMVTRATNLPFKAPGLQWMGGPSITLTQLQKNGRRVVGGQTMDDTGEKV